MYVPTFVCFLWHGVIDLVPRPQHSTEAARPRTQARQSAVRTAESTLVTESHTQEQSAELVTNVKGCSGDR